MIAAEGSTLCSSPGARGASETGETDILATSAAGVGGGKTGT